MARLSELAGIGSPPYSVQTYRLGDHYVIVSEWERAGVLTPADAVAHARLLENVGKAQTVVPVRLGTVAQDLKDLDRAIKDNEGALSDLLYKLAGRMEVGIKVYWTDKLLQETIAKHVDLERAKIDSLMNPAREREIAMEVGQVAQQITDEWRERALSLLMTRLRPHTDDAVIGRLTSIYMLANVSFLIRRDAEPIFQAEVCQLGVDIGKDFEIHYANNLPPFNFANLNLRRNAHGGTVS